MFAKNDSPNGLLIDGLCIGLGVIFAAVTNHLVYERRLPRWIEYVSVFMLFGLLVITGVLAIQKTKKIAFTPRIYAVAMSLYGWGAGTFIILSIHSK